LDRRLPHTAYCLPQIREEHSLRRHPGGCRHSLCVTRGAVAILPYSQRSANSRRQTESSGTSTARGRREARPVRHLGQPGLAWDRCGQRRQWDRRRARHACGVAARAGAVFRHRIRRSGRAAVSASRARTQEAAHGRQHEGQPGCALPADGQHAALHASAAAQDYSDAVDRRDPVWRERGHQADPHWRPSAAWQRPAAVVVRLLHRQVGGRHARGRDHWIPWWWLAGRERQSADRRREDDRALHARELRQSRHRGHCRRSQGVHAAVDGDDQERDHARYRADRVHLPREREVNGAF